MISILELTNMSEVSINDINRDDIPNFKDIKINIDLPIDKRLEKFSKEIENIFFFKHENIIVKINYADEKSKSIQELLTRVLINKKNN